MFGTLQAPRASLRTCDEQAWRQVYCGLCQTTGQRQGHPWRALQSHDAVFLALLAEGLTADAPAASSTRCPMVPTRVLPTISPERPSLRFAAAVQVKLGDQWLADKEVEGTRWAPWGRRLLQGPVDRADEELDVLEVSLAELDGFEHRQARVEASWPRPAAAAAPTAYALQVVFSALGTLPGIDTLDGAAREQLATLGTALGEVIYHTDALEDLSRDARSGDFNPCLDPDSRQPEAGRVNEATAALDEALGRARACLQALPLARHRRLLEQVLDDELAPHAARATTAARATCDATLRQHLQGPVTRWMQLAASLLAVWFTVAANTAYAATSVALGPDAARAVRGWFAPKLANNPCDACADICGGCGDAFGQCGDGCNQCGDTCDQCGSSCDGCSKSCNDCGDSCNQCGDGCSNCGDGCNDCGNGCNDCGQGCNNC